MPRRVFLWNGGDPDSVTALLPLADALPLLPAPRPLRRSLELGFQWGAQRIDVVAIASELVTTDWGEDAATGLHLKAAPVAEYLAGKPLAMQHVLVPVRYVIGIDVGPTFQVARFAVTEDLAVFPPNQPTPEGAVPLDEVERVLAELLAAERN